MIPPSTLRKLQEKGADVYRVIWSAHKVTLNGQPLETPEHRDYFATERGANNSIQQVAELILAGVHPMAQFDIIPACAMDALACTELAPKPYKGYL